MASYSVFKSIIIDASIEKVWSQMGEFNGMPTWHPSIVESTLLAADDQHYCGDIPVRRLVTPDGAVIIEELLEIVDEENVKSIKYGILESPMPITQYVSLLSIKRVSEDSTKTYCEWTSTFNSDVPAMVASIGDNVYVVGLTNLKKMNSSN